MFLIKVWECYKEIHGEDDERSVRIENILIDLDRLDSMFTSEDRVVIDENVRFNEETHFGSQDFEKFILPKLTFNNESESDDSAKEEDDEESSENEEREINIKANPEEVILHDESKVDKEERKKIDSILDVPNTEDGGVDKQKNENEDCRTVNPIDNRNDTNENINKDDDDYDDKNDLNSSKEIKDNNNETKDVPNEIITGHSKVNFLSQLMNCVIDLYFNTFQRNIFINV